MPTTKAPDKKTVTRKASDEKYDQSLEVLSDEVLQILLHRALVTMGEPARLGEIIRELGDDTVTAGLARYIVDRNSRRFVSVDRRWDLAQRYLDPMRPVSRSVEEIISNHAAPVPADEIAVELSHIYHRVREHFDDVAIRLLRGAQYFAVDNGRAFGLASWLLDISSTKEEDLIFFNMLDPQILKKYKKTAAGADWSDLVAASHDIIAAAGLDTIDNRVLQYFAFAAVGEDYEPAEHYQQLYDRSDLFLALPNHRWILLDQLSPVRDNWSKIAETAEDRPMEDAPVAPIVEVVNNSLEVTQKDLAELRLYFADKESIVTSSDILQHVFEIRPTDPTFAADSKTVIDYLKLHKDDFQWVGNDRFRTVGTMPPYIGQIPESLSFPVLPQFVTPDGEILDQMLMDAGFDQDLQADVYSSIAQDVNDQDGPDSTIWPEGVSADAPSIRLVLKPHHKEIGTFPLAQIPRGFLPVEPSIVELTLVDGSGNAYPVYVDYNVQLMYGLFDAYEEISADSGAVFHLEKTDDPAEVRFINDGETDSGTFISAARFADLTEQRAEAEASDSLSTYDIIKAILQHHHKGVSFLTLLTEVNVVRRTPRRLLASVLSAYAAFHFRANRWTFDAKLEQEGFDESKTAYLLK